MVEVPTWLNKQFIEKVIKHSDNGDEGIKVLNISVTPATAKGDNYASDMLRVTVDYADTKSNKGKRSLVIKLLPQKEGVQQDMISQAGLFKTEITMMTNTLKKMNSLIGWSSRFSSTAFYTQNEDPALLVLEDLSPLGYQMANRHSGLDMEHSTMAIRSLAKFHAASVAVCEKEPNQTSFYNKGLFNKLNPPEFERIFNNTLKVVADEVANWPEAKQYAAKLSALSSSGYDLAIVAAARDDNEFNVINHGDYWVNNMLFRYENNKPVGHIMADFQLSYYSSPAIDLLYFVNTSISEDIYHNHKDSVLEEYHKTLLETMTRLGCKTNPPNIDDLQRAMKKHAFIGVMTSLATLPIILVDKAKVKDVNEMISVDCQIDSPGIKSETFRNVLSKRLPLYDADGLLDLVN